MGRLRAAVHTSSRHLFGVGLGGNRFFPSHNGTSHHEPEVSAEMNEWERERRRTNTLQSPGEGNTWAASAPGSIPNSQGSAFHIPSGLPTPGCRMLWTGASTSSLSVHDQTFLFALKVGAGPPCSSKQLSSQRIGIFPPPKTFAKSFPAWSHLWLLRACQSLQLFQ